MGSPQDVQVGYALRRCLLVAQRQTLSLVEKGSKGMVILAKNVLRTSGELDNLNYT
jgi:hypothetical protein